MASEINNTITELERASNNHFTIFVKDGDVKATGGWCSWLNRFVYWKNDYKWDKDSVESNVNAFFQKHIDQLSIAELDTAFKALDNLRIRFFANAKYKASYFKTALDLIEERQLQVNGGARDEPTRAINIPSPTERGTPSSRSGSAFSARSAPVSPSDSPVYIPPSPPLLVLPPPLPAPAVVVFKPREYFQKEWMNQIPETMAISGELTQHVLRCSSSAAVDQLVGTAIRKHIDERRKQYDTNKNYWLYTLKPNLQKKYGFSDSYLNGWALDYNTSYQSFERGVLNRAEGSNNVRNENRRKLHEIYNGVLETLGLPSSEVIQESDDLLFGPFEFNKHELKSWVLEQIAPQILFYHPVLYRKYTTLEAFRAALNRIDLYEKDIGAEVKKFVQTELHDIVFKEFTSYCQGHGGTGEWTKFKKTFEGLFEKGLPFVYKGNEFGAVSGKIPEAYIDMRPGHIVIEDHI